MLSSIPGHRSPYQIAGGTILMLPDRPETGASGLSLLTTDLAGGHSWEEASHPIDCGVPLVPDVVF